MSELSVVPELKHLSPSVRVGLGDKEIHGGLVQVCRLLGPTHVHHWGEKDVEIDQRIRGNKQEGATLLLKGRVAVGLV